MDNFLSTNNNQTTQNLNVNQNANVQKFPLDDKDIQKSITKHGKSQRRKKFLKVFAIILTLALVIGAGGYFGYRLFIYAPDYTSAEKSNDKVTITILEGETTSDIAKALLDSEVVKSERAFTNAVKNRNNPTIQYGKYSILKHQSGSAALTSLLDRNNILKIKFTIPEGKTLYQTLNIISDASGSSFDDLTQALDQLKSNLPDGVSSFEGWLFPSTYTFDYDTNPVDILKEMLDETWALLYKYNVTMDEAENVIIKASIVQKEVTTNADMAKVARVIENRLESGMPLGMDTIVAYGVNQGNGESTLELNQSDLDDATAPYNARMHTGLPPTPISNPGEAAIAAVVNPADGDWLYFITVDPSTGETLFFNNEADFNDARVDYKTWCANHSDICYG